MYLNLFTLQECSEAEIKLVFSNTSFASPFTPPDGYAVLFSRPHPTYDPLTQSVQKGTPELTEKGHWEQTWEVVPRFNEYTDEDGVTHTVAEQEAAAIAADAEVKAAQEREAAKAARKLAVENTKVTTTAGNTFDGDETSQDRMSRAILTMQLANVNSTTWVLANNMPVTVTLTELSEALLLAGLEQTRLWVI